MRLLVVAILFFCSSQAFAGKTMYATCGCQIMNEDGIFIKLDLGFPTMPFSAGSSAMITGEADVVDLKCVSNDKGEMTYACDASKSEAFEAAIDKCSAKAAMVTEGGAGTLESGTCMYMLK